MTSLKEQITDKLTQRLAPSFLEVINESHQHNVPAGSESHFKIIVASDFFQGKNLLQRHRDIYEILTEEMKTIHALSLYAYTPEEWQNQPQIPNSPDCRGGSKK